MPNLPHQCHACSVRASGQRGGLILLMVAVVLTLAASTLALKFANNPGAPLAQTALTQRKLHRIEKALQAFCFSHNNTLPDPANGALSEDVAQAGVSNFATPVANRVLPWRTLGLTAEEGRDAWGRKFTYATGPNVDGLPALWVVVSHGPSGLGGWLVAMSPQAALRQPPFPPVSASEANNMQGPFQKRPANAPLGMLAATDPAHFDDILMYATTGAGCHWSVR